jgi:hypothetical protein
LKAGGTWEEKSQKVKDDLLAQLPEGEQSPICERERRIQIWAGWVVFVATSAAISIPDAFVVSNSCTMTET